MKAVVYDGPRQIRYADVREPVLAAPHGAIVKVTLASVCGSDLHVHEGAEFRPGTGFCLGHEAVGRVVETGPAVTGFEVGDRVMIPGSVGCSTCQPCRLGRVSVCETRSRNDPVSCYGLGPDLQGSQAEFVFVPHAATNLWRTPSDVSDESAVVLVDAAATALYGLRRARMVPGDNVAIVGLGPIGNLMGRLALIAGAARVFGIDPSGTRRTAAGRAGLIPLGPENAKGEIRDATGGLGVEVVLEAAGTDASIGLALALARVTGRVSIVGVTTSKAFPLHLQLAQIKELEIATGLCSVQFELPSLLRLTSSGQLDPAAVVTHNFPLSEAASVYARLLAREDGLLKVTLNPAC